MKYVFKEKFSEQQIDDFINSVYLNFKKTSSDTYLFDLTKIEWISNQGLLLITSLLKYFINRNIKFELLLIPKGISTKDVPKRVAIQIIQLWETWGIWKIIPDQKYREYLGVDFNTIQSLKQVNGISLNRPEIFDSVGITPFICLDEIKNPSDNEIIEQLSKYHSLNDATKQIVENNNCAHPFVGGLFGEILSREIYENFLDHYGSTFFNAQNNFAFLSLSLKGKIDEEYFEATEIQNKLKLNFQTEELLESKEFFKNDKTKKYKNRPYINYSFIDYGEGIVTTLKSEFEKQIKDSGNYNDSDIIKFAFLHNTSRFPIQNVFNGIEIKDFIPRGLFDVITLVKRYSGILIIRSCNGKVLYNFSHTQDTDEACRYFGDVSKFFPGTFITIYLPALEQGKEIDSSVIKPEYDISDFKKGNAKYVSLKGIIDKVNQGDIKDRNDTLFEEIRNAFYNNQETLTYFSLENISDKQLIKKVIYYLIADYGINTRNNVVIFHPPKREILEEINFEILGLSNVNRRYKLHPLPFIFFNEEQHNIDLYWLGIFDEADKKKLDQLQYDQFSLAKSDFNDPESIIGHLNYFDKHNNLETFFPSRSNVIEFYTKGELFARITELRTEIESQCISRDSENVYLCSGNYYQKEYLELFRILNDQNKCDQVSDLLYSLLEKKLDDQIGLDSGNFKFIAVTSASERILNALIENQKIDPVDKLFVDNYHDVRKLKDILPASHEKYSYILVCDAISTGHLVRQIDQLLGRAELKCIAVVADTQDSNFELTKNFQEEFKDRIVSLVQYPIKKYLKQSSEVKKFIESQNVKRINPYTNIPISLSIEDTNPNSVILSPDEFLYFVKDEDVKIGFLKFNNLIHPYFFDTKSILQRDGVALFKSIVNKRDKHGALKIKLETSNLRIFYPKKSDIVNVDFKELKRTVFKDHSVVEFPLERFNVEDGWKFPHTTEYIGEIVFQNQVLILDDGTCSGDSLTQMLNEIAFYQPKNIIILSLVGRLHEHKREFLSLISRIQKKNKEIDVRIFFGTQWHIPTYYLNDNPNSTEYNRLLEVQRINNTPSKLRGYAASISNSLRAERIEDFQNHKYLPKHRSTGLIPRKELIRVRDEVGKVIGFRFYTESFNWFNSFIKKYESSRGTKLNRNTEAELLCGTISYEPYLFERLRKILPDVADKLRKFIDSIFFGNPERKQKQIPLNDLTYLWDPRDFIHLFFIFYPGEDGIKKLKEENNLQKIISFIKVNSVSVDYLWFKILHLLPLNIEDFQNKEPIQVQALLKSFLSVPNLDDNFVRQLNVFRAYVSTLPSRKSYRQQVLDISDDFEKLNLEQYHKSSIRAQLSLLLSDIHKLNINFHSLDIEKFINTWKNVSKFLAQILAFTKSYPTYCPLGIFKEIQDLRVLYGSLNEQIINIRPDSNLRSIETGLVEIRSKVFNSQSEIFKLFHSPYIFKLKKVLADWLKQLNLTSQCQLNFEVSEGTQIMFPLFYFREIVLESVGSNLRHRDSTNDPFSLSVIESKDTGYVEILIDNKIKAERNSGSGYGTIRFNHAREFPNRVFSYHPYSKNRRYTQIIKLRKT